MNIMTGEVLRRLRVSPSSRLAWAAGLAALALGACGTTGPAGPSPAPETRPVAGAPPDPVALPVDLIDPAYTPAHLRGQALTRVGLLLPFSASNQAVRAEASHILRAAELALFERAGDTVLIMPRDTRGTREGALQAAESVISDGADLVLGPLLSASVEAVGGVARRAGVPVIAFSTDRAVAGDGVYLLSFPPGEEVRRVVDYAVEQGATRFAFIGPLNAYGQTAQQAYAEAIEALLGPEPLPELAEIELPLPEDAPEDAEPARIERVFHTGLVASEFYDPEGGVSAMIEAAGRLAALGLEELDPAEAARMSGANWRPSAASPFQVVLLPEGGDNLRTLAPVLVFQDIDPLLVKFTGTSLWRDESLAREPALAHGWFAGPDPEARSRFESVYQAVYGGEPSRLAGLGYDAAALAAALAGEGGRISRERLEAPEGFSGVDGLFRFREDGQIERGLVVYTMRSGGFRVLDPAPERFIDDVEAEDVDPDPAS